MDQTPMRLDATGIIGIYIGTLCSFSKADLSFENSVQFYSIESFIRLLLMLFHSFSSSERL